MKIGIEEYEELKRLGLDYNEAQAKADECNTIRELEYTIYLKC